MDVGLFIFPTAESIDMAELGAAAEERGFESLFVAEHTHIPVSRKTPFPGGGELPEEYRQTYDPFVALTAAAVTTQRIKLGTGICLVAQRDTLTTAKCVASLDRVSGGRVLFGIGAGWNRDEMENHGTEYDSRFRKLEEQIDVFRKLWNDDVAEFHGEFVDFDPVWQWPKPLQNPVPILLGGGTRHTRQRVAEKCEGWMPVGRSPEGVMRGIEDMRRRTEEAGRDPNGISVSVYGAHPKAEVVDAYREAGVDRVVLPLPPRDREDVLPRLDRYTEFLT